MVVFARSPLGIVVSGLVSIAIAAFIYFVIVKPSTDSANNTARQAIQQAQPQLQHAQSLQDCIARAGGDTTKIAACR
jgi:large-conductance mechanosensitive channel